MVYFQTKNPNFGLFGMENKDIFYGHFGTFKSIWCILPRFGKFCGNLVYIFTLWNVRTRKNLAALAETSFPRSVSNSQDRVSLG
jgi:hypothetical protein